MKILQIFLIDHASMNVLKQHFALTLNFTFSLDEVFGFVLKEMDTFLILLYTVWGFFPPNL